jgi:long-chain fatty acid transport protein
MMGARVCLRAACVLVASFGVAGDALATEGYFQYGFGARQKALGGAGVADSRDATAIALNPAGLVHVGNQVTFSVTAFSPQREYNASEGCTPAASCPPVLSGEIESDREFFPIPNLGYSRRLGPDTVFALGVYGNGGMNTTYSEAVFDFFDGDPGNEGGDTGVDLTQMFVSGALSHRMGQVSAGVAPILAVQFFEAQGIRNFGGFSADGRNVSDNGHDISYGAGLRAGIEYAAAPWLRFGVAGNTRIHMTEFDDYAGLFAEEGDFDIPASLTAGVAIDLRPDMTLMVDYKRIWYGDIKAINNSSLLLRNAAGGDPNARLGEDGGAGFGWDDIDIFKVGLEWRYDDQWTLRAGYAYNENPIGSDDVAINILAPGVVQHHITGGFKYAWSDDLDIEFAAAFVPENDVSGQHPFGAQDIEISMWQMEATLGAVWHLDEPEAPLEPLK